jgi:hypothetical protein
MNSIKKERITLIFNVLLFIYIFITGMAIALFEPEFVQKPLIEKMLGDSILLIIIVFLSIGVFLLIAGAQLFKVFWNRFVTDVFRLREVTFQESLAVILIAGMIFL